MFKCKVCAEKQARISDLLAQISYLKSLLTPNTDLTAQQLEADAIMSGRQDVIELHPESEPAAPTAEDILSERDRIFAANY